MRRLVLIGIAIGFSGAGMMLLGRACESPSRPIHSTRANAPAFEASGHEEVHSQLPTRPKREERILWELNNLCTHDDSISYRDFKAIRSYNNRQQTSSVTIQKSGRTIASLRTKPGAWSVQSACFGLTSVLGRGSKQLLIVQTSGGAHCCFFYTLYDLYPKFRRIFRSDKYPIGDGFDELKFSDLDRDGVMEFTQLVMTFDYCCDMSYAASPHPTIVFKYAPRRRVFLPESRRFKKFLLQRVREQRAKAREEPIANWPYLFAAFTQYIYAGQEKTAWRIYNSSEGNYLPRKREIRKLLNADPIYRFIYQH